MLSIRSLFKRKNNSGNNFRITRLEETDSTNAYIHRMLTDPQQSESTPVADQARYSVVTTEFQSSGRGQGTNTWESERGKNLLFSILCHPVWVPVTGQFILSEAIALAIRDALAAYAKKEHDEDQRPAIKNAIDLSDYDTVFIGYPMWWYTFPMIIYTLFDTVDFSGKTVVPFNTHMGSRDGGTYKTVREKARGATVLEGLPVSMKEAEGGAGKAVEKWLTKLGLKK